MTIANRLLLGFTAVTLLLVALGAYAVSRIGEVRDATQTIVTRDLAAFRQLETVRVSQTLTEDARQGAVTRFLLLALGEAPGATNPVDLWRQRAAETEAALTEASTTANGFRTSAVSADRAEAWRRIGEALAEAGVQLGALRGQSEEQFRQIDAANQPLVLAQEEAIATTRAALDEALDQADTVLDGAIAAGQARVEDIYERSRTSVLIGIVLAVLVSVVMTYFLRRSIVRPLDAFVGFVERVGRGDLAGSAAEAGDDELGRLGGNLNRMVEGLRELARQSRDATANLNAAAAEIRASTQQQAAGVEEQLAAVQETAATVDQITHSGVQIGKRAQEVIATAQATAATSGAGLKAVVDTQQGMDAIRDQAEAVAENIVALSEKTQAIGEIVSTVNDISERSHLLALNAAIEAASAGEAGRSFAVVAQEMKGLADQAKDATQQVRSILGEIQRGINASVMLTEEAVKRVNAGKERTDTTRRTIEDITARIQESVMTFQQIVASTNQQQLGIEQVTAALQSIRQASQQTAAGTRQLDSAAGNLSGLSQQLLTLVERYRL